MRLAAAALALALGLLVWLPGAPRAENIVTIGAIFPLAGVSDKSGYDAMAAIEVAANIVDVPHKGLESLPLGAGRGLPNLGNADLAVAFTYHQGNPSVATSQVLRLAEQNHVAALIGGGEGPAILAAATEAERHGVPFLVPDATDPKLNGRGFGWVFRTTPLAADIDKAYVQFLTQVKAAGTQIDRVVLVAGNDASGSAWAQALGDALRAAGLAADTVTYAPNGIDLSASVTALRDKHPDAVIFACNAADASLFVKTMKTLDYKPPILIGDDSGFSDPGFVAADANLAQGLIDRSVWSIGKEDSPAAIVNALYKVKTGHDLDDRSGRVLQGFLVLADAVNRAGSTDPAAIQRALRDTDLKPEQLIVGYDGVKFDASGQNTLAATYLTQLQGKQYVTVWPAGRAAGKLALPYKAWLP